MSGISIKISGISPQVAAITVRIVGDGCLTGGAAGFSLSGATHGVALTGDTIRFTPAFQGSATQNIDLAIAMPLGSDGDPVIQIDAELGVLAAGAATSPPLFPGPWPNPSSLLGRPSGIGFGEVAGTLGQFLPFAQSPAGMGPFSPAAPAVEQQITVAWPTATERRSERAAVGMPLTLAGYAG
ncbi:hypothetical protein RZN05_18135 [Sphingomonas sp. HF-S4]|uniref:Uncharacterized protein n=1 Tax=Sphingomonas agrestis TaxID=3080540 RepID=A0ABU3YBZ8_9SPHN|nr:hypothetical protein [Sphingomonas sp. HF-S4]MDV3458923.1 hypothetical protein [Sphingomonas sp. HF-S4]